jgi:uncharacterized coiled-coil protein SlyX
VEEQDRKAQEQEVRLTRQEATITQLKFAAAKQKAVNLERQKQIQALTATLKEQAAQIQKVSDELEVSRPVPQIIADNQ